MSTFLTDYSVPSAHDLVVKWSRFRPAEAGWSYVPFANQIVHFGTLFVTLAPAVKYVLFTRKTVKYGCMRIYCCNHEPSFSIPLNI